MSNGQIVNKVEEALFEQLNFLYAEHITTDELDNQWNSIVLEVLENLKATYTEDTETCEECGTCLPRINWPDGEDCPVCFPNTEASSTDMNTDIRDGWHLEL